MKIERLSFATVECYNFEIISIFGYKQKKFISYNFEFFILKILKDLLDMYLFRKHIYNKNILSNKKLKNALMHSIESIFLSLEHRDSYTAYHQIKVAMLSLAIYDHRKLNKKYRLDTLFGGLIHDIGKLYIPLDLLMAPRRLVKEEYDLIKLHSQKGYDIVENLPISDYTKEIILQHHERLYGSGYPNGLENEKISNGAKIIAVADVFDAMYSNRPYREKLPLSIVKEELISNRDILYCSESINSCIQLIENDFKFPNIDFNIKKFFKEIDNI